MSDLSRLTVSRVYVYVDGFNFYHATLGTPAYSFGWCNWRATAENYCGASRQVTKVKYFTSEILSNDKAKRERQALHLKAMKTVAELIYGQFKPREQRCTNCGHSKQFSREKMTDTNIAIHLVHDAGANRYDEAFLITADMDLLPAIQMVTSPRHFKTPRKVTVLIPPNAETSREFRESLDQGLSKERAAELGHEFPAHWNEGSKGPPLKTDFVRRKQN